jgi:hypothetical protein
MCCVHLDIQSLVVTLLCRPRVSRGILQGLWEGVTRLGFLLAQQEQGVHSCMLEHLLASPAQPQYLSASLRVKPCVRLPSDTYACVPTGKTTFLRALAGGEIKGLPQGCQVLHVEQEVVGDDTPVIQVRVLLMWPSSCRNAGRFVATGRRLLLRSLTRYRKV